MNGPMQAGAIRRAGGAIALTAVLLPLVPTGAAAHPLGDFTINHYTGVRVTPSSVVVDRVIDRAEIPTFQARAAIDTDGDDAISDAETAAWRDTSCAADREQVRISAAGVPVSLTVDDAAVAFPMGQGALTTRLVCRYTGVLAVPLGTAPVAFRIDDLADRERIGWREIVLAGDTVTIQGSDVPRESVSARLTDYPSDPLVTGADQRSAVWFAVTGGPALPPFVAPELASVASAASTVVPNGIAELGLDVATLFQARELTLGIVVLSLLVAAGLGALHAASPGHGKTVMAAYLVGSRGTSRHALGLGLTVTLSHTLGVLVLAGVTLAASSVISPERLYPVLGGVSGAIVVLIAAWLLAGQLRSWRRERASARVHDHPHGHAHDEHDHGHEHGHPGHEHPRVDHDHDAEAGWHSHGGIRHTHLPPTGGALSVRGLFALGLAGGMVPSVSAMILLLGSIAMGRPAYGVALTVAFGVGMAAVLVGVGVGLVHARGLLERLPSRPVGVRLSQLAPSLSASVMLAAGVLITSQAVLALR